MSLLFIRTVISYVFIVLALRVTGKRQIGELQPSELVLTFMISNIATLPLQEIGMPLLSSLLPIATLIALELAISVAMMKFPAFRRMISGKSVQVIRNGKIIENNLRKLRLTVDELCEELRLMGNFKIEDIVHCGVETNGKLSVLKKYEVEPVTPKLLNISDEKTVMTYLIISDGKIQKNALNMCGFDKNWIDKKLLEQKLSVKDVLVMTADENGDCYIMKKENKG